MMRKDVRIGFAIGGVLLAVLIVYGLVTSGPNPRNNEVTLAPDDPAAGGGAGSASRADQKQSSDANKPQPGSGTSSGAAQPGERAGQRDLTGGNAPTAGADRPTGTNAGNGSASGSGNGSVAAKAPPTTGPTDKWERALNHGVLMVHTETPSLGSAPTQPPVTEGTTAGEPETTGTNAGELVGAQTSPADSANPGIGGNSAAAATNAMNATGATGGAGNPGGAAGGGVIDARVLADLAAGGSGATAAPNSAASPPSPVTSGAAGTGQRTHVVQPNETFASIAEMAYGSQAYYPHIVRANPNVNPKRLRAGMTIVLPGRDQVVAKESKALEGAQLSAASSPGSSTGAVGPSGATGVGVTGTAGTTGTVTVAGAPLDEKTHYRVQPGESLYKIALRLYGRIEKIDAIYDLNKDAIGPNRDRLKAGTVLKLPEPPTTAATAAR
jgi:nucleoid-associated protein YgaU